MIQQVRLLRGVLCAVLCILPYSAFSEIYIRTDEQGRVHYGDAVAAGGEGQWREHTDLPALNRARAHPVSTSAERKPVVRKQALRKKAAKPGCKKYREKIAHYQDKLRSGYREPAGNRYRLKIRQLSAYLRENCRK